MAMGKGNLRYAAPRVSAGQMKELPSDQEHLSAHESPSQEKEEW